MTSTSIAHRQQLQNEERKPREIIARNPIVPVELSFVAYFYDRRREFSPH